METQEASLWLRQYLSEVSAWANDILEQIGLKVMEGDEAFFYLHRDGD